MGVQLGHVDQKKYHHPKTTKTKRIQYDAIIASQKIIRLCRSRDEDLKKKKKRHRIVNKIHLFSISQERNIRTKRSRIQLRACGDSRCIKACREGSLADMLWAKTIKVSIIKLVIQIVSVIFFLITFNPWATCNLCHALVSFYELQDLWKEYQTKVTFNALVSGFALWAGLIPLSSLILIARPAYRKGTFIASNKWLSILCNLNFIATYLTSLSAQFFHGLYLHIPKELSSSA